MTNAVTYKSCTCRVGFYDIVLFAELPPSFRLDSQTQNPNPKLNNNTKPLSYITKRKY